MKGKFMTLTTCLVYSFWLQSLVLSDAVATPDTSSVSDLSAFHSAVTDSESDVDYQQAIVLLEKKEFAAAASFLERAANRGVIVAQYRLGMMYAQGIGIERDLSLALRWLKTAAPNYEAAAQQLQAVRYELRNAYTDEFDRSWAAAQTGDALSMFKLAIMFQDGVGTSPNAARALEWLEKAAQLNVADAQARLGTMYLNGEYVTQDFQQAQHWLTQAASFGESVSMALLGTLYRDAKGVQRNVVTAMQWFILSAYHGNQHALSSLDELVRWHANPAQQQAAQQAALMWLLQQSGARFPPEFTPTPPPSSPENPNDPRHENELEHDL
jgi:uncharacterized protein